MCGNTCNPSKAGIANRAGSRLNQTLTTKFDLLRSQYVKRQNSLMSVPETLQGLSVKAGNTNLLSLPEKTYDQNGYYHGHNSEYSPSHGNYNFFIGFRVICFHFVEHYFVLPTFKFTPQFRLPIALSNCLVSFFVLLIIKAPPDNFRSALNESPTVTQRSPSYIICTMGSLDSIVRISLIPRQSEFCYFVHQFGFSDWFD